MLHVPPRTVDRLRAVEKSQAERDAFQSQLYQQEQQILDQERGSYKRLRDDLAQHMTEEEKKIIKE